MPLAVKLWRSENLFFFLNALEKAKALQNTLWGFIKLLLSALIHKMSLYVLCLVLNTDWLLCYI